MENVVRTQQRGRAAAHRDFQRAYKACIPCRQRKAKCELPTTDADGAAIGPPCARCRRQQVQCVFSDRKAWARKKNSSNQADGGPSASQQSLPHDVGRWNQTVNADLTHSPGDGYDTSIPNYDSMGGNGTTHKSASNERENNNRQQPASNELADSMMRTVVSNENDALNILFEAAVHDRDDDPNGLDTQENGIGNGQGPHDGHPPAYSYGTPGSGVSNRTNTVLSNPVELSSPTAEVLNVWGACRFVKMGWFSAREAVTYIDLFFKNMSPLTPVMADFYSNHGSHYWLVTQEPMLCCTILMISSRYHVLPGVGGMSRGVFIHHRLWQHCQHLVMRVMFGQEKSSKAKTRTIGTIEALLLMSEWHPQSLHFPPESDGWDSDLLLTIPDSRDTTAAEAPPSNSHRWLEDVIEPARRSDRMSWMLLGAGLTLAHELGIFETDEQRTAGTPNTERGAEAGNQTQVRRKRVRLLLYVLINQLSLRLGCVSLMPQSLNHTIAGGLSTPPADESNNEWLTFMGAWMDLTKLVKSVTNMFFPSVSLAKQQLQTGRYIDLLDHFRPLLDQWKNKHLYAVSNKTSFNMLFIEYHFVRAYTHSFGMQAVVERALAEAGLNGEVRDLHSTTMDDIDYEFIQEVIDSCCQILERVIQLTETGALRFSPVRIFLRVTSASVFLLKALSLGVRNAKLQESLDILDRSIEALRSSSLDDIHLASRYATLLGVHVSRLRQSFAASSKNTTRPSRAETRLSSMAPQQRTSNGGADGPGNMNGSQEPLDPAFTLSLDDIAADDWLSLPFDPSMAPFSTAGGEYPGFEGGNLDFIWNLPS